MRELQRAVARTRMQKRGVQKMNKQRYAFNPTTQQWVCVGSYFSQNWRKWAR